MSASHIPLVAGVAQPVPQRLGGQHRVADGARQARDRHDGSVAHRQLDASPGAGFAGRRTGSRAGI
jgi:hypothetical protein